MNRLSTAGVARRVTAVLLLVLLTAVAGAGGTRLSPTMVHAATATVQEPPLSVEDEFWVVDEAVAICNAANDSDNEDEDCDGPAPLHAPLRDCLRYAARENVSSEAARRLCSTHVRNPGSYGPRTSFDVAGIQAGVESTVASEVALLTRLGIDQATIERFTAALRPCVLERDLTGSSFQTLHDTCRAAFRPAEEVWLEAAAQTFSNSLSPLLDQGYTAADVLRGVDSFRSCLLDSLASASLTSAISDDVTRCEFQARTEAGLGRGEQGAPSVGSVTCTPSPVAAGNLVSCSATITGTVTGWQWSAPGGNPNALDGGSSTGETVNFATVYETSGDKTIELTACNRAAATAQLPERNLCAVGAATVTVTAVAPTIDALSCTAGPVATGDVVSCTATVGGSTGTTSRRWSAPGGDPSDGRGPSFSTQYAQANSYTITFRACNGADPLDGTGGDPRACAEQSRTVQVRGGAAPAITSLGCNKSMVAVNDPVTCTPSLSGMVTSLAWSAPGGAPGEGSAMSFTTRFAAAGARAIFLEACNGTACTTLRQSVTVTGAAATTCTQWDVTGTWHTTQGNGYSPTFTFQQNGTSISGSATLSAGDQSRGGFTSPSGSVVGSIRGDQLDVTVTWAGRNGPVTGRYTATVVQGRLTNGNAGGVSWTGSGPTRCVTMA